jgi:hypothetical protein
MCDVIWVALAKIGISQRSVNLDYGTAGTFATPKGQSRFSRYWERTYNPGHRCGAKGPTLAETE